jgi:TolB-like protein/DNA-binding winged helix-turn-helix (wHTH) protein
MSFLTSHLYEFGEFRLDAQQRVLRRGEEPIALTPKAFDLLVLLIQHGGEVVTKDELMKAVWADSFVEESNLTQTVFMLRKALEESPDQRYILTVQGRGYRFVENVKEISDNGHPGPDMAVSKHVGAAGPAASPETTPFRLIALRKSSLLLLGGIAFVALAAALFAYLHWFASRTQTAEARVRPLLAVLPFQNLTGDPAQEYLSDGLTEEMITQLGNLDPGHLGVIARTSVMHYKNSQTALDQIGRELGVQYVMEGSVRRDENSVRVTAQLIQTKDQTHLWARQYDREMKGLLPLQAEIAREVADEIQITLDEHKPGAAQPPPVPQNYESYDLYLKGQYFFNKRTQPDLEEAVRYFQRATDKDPKYARAYAGLAACYALLPDYSGQPDSDFIANARAAALKALDIDPTLPEAHTVLALIVQNHDWDWQTAEREYRRAIELNPNYATAHHWYAEHLMWRARFDEALVESERARQLDPLSLIIAADNGAILYFSRQNDRAIEKWRSVSAMDPDFLRAHLIVGAYVEQGKFAEALADNERLRAKNPAQSYWAWRAYIYGRAGQTAEAHHATQELLRINQSQPVDPIYIASAYIGVGDKATALAWLEKAYRGHSHELATLKVNPAYDSLRGDQQFRDLLRRVRLDE